MKEKLYLSSRWPISVISIHNTHITPKTLNLDRKDVSYLIIS